MSGILINSALAVFLCAGTLYAEQDRAIQVVASRNNDGSISGALAGETINLGTYKALWIGINRYEHPEFAPNLSTALNDVSNLCELFIKHFGFDNENVKLLLDEKATRSGILEALALYRDAPLGASDNLLIYFAGHGFQHPGTEDGFWIPSDATSNEATWVPVSEIRRIIKNIKAKHTLLVSDSCFSGTLTRSTVVIPTNDRFLMEVAKIDSYQALTSGGLEPVADGGRDGMSLFAFSLTSYLKNPVRPYFTAAQLYADLAPVVANASGSRQTPEYGRIPETFDQKGQFIFTQVDLPENVPAATSSPSPVTGPKPASTLNPMAAAPTVAESISFLNISFTPPTDWILVKNQPGQALEYKHVPTDYKIVLNTYVNKNMVEALSNNLSNEVKTLSKSFQDNFKKQGFKDIAVEMVGQKPVKDFYLYSFEITYRRPGTPSTLWLRSDLFVDAETSRVYQFDSTAELASKGVSVEAMRQLMESLQRTGK
jgi:hypothetical protein